jgi:hypothetical protein
MKLTKLSVVLFFLASMMLFAGLTTLGIASLYYWTFFASVGHRDIGTLLDVWLVPLVWVALIVCASVGAIVARKRHTRWEIGIFIGLVGSLASILLALFFIRIVPLRISLAPFTSYAYSFVLLVSATWIFFDKRLIHSVPDNNHSTIGTA